MTDIIESHGGYVDKYIGDSIVAMFGAPADDPAHARNAVHAALKCHEKLAELNAGSAAFAGRGLSHRIGLNSGEAVVGNIGSRRRFNYTVMSDTVNVASRLEGANKYYGTAIMASESTMAQTGDSFAWRELDAIRVLGRGETIRVFEPLADKGAESAGQKKAAAAYAEGLACWRAREFAKAADAFEGVAKLDPPSSKFAKRARALAEHPPLPEWTPVNTLEGK
jgi:adenylate cyclase